MMFALRKIALVSSLTALAVGCLFPSFDELKSNSDTTKPDPDDDDDTSSEPDGAKSSTSSGGGSSGTTTSSSSSGAADTGTDTAGPSPKTIQCGSKVCTLPQVCCDNGFGQVECSNSCDLWEFRCDDFTDCPDGQRCCKPEATDLTIRCAASCNGGSEICTTATGCKSGSCTANLPGPPDVTFKMCQ